VTIAGRTFHLTGSWVTDCSTLFDAAVRERASWYPRQLWTLRRRVVLYLEPQCRQCSAKAWEVDHITPRCEGGTDAWDNLQPLCCACHDAKTRTDLARMRG
jgi:5-methylcytosine-specific restriction endonuclease McrA